MTEYENKDYTVNFEKFKTADIVKRGNYWFVDVTYYDNSKDTNFKFTERGDAEKFLNYCFETFAENKDTTEYNKLDLCLWFAIGFVSALLCNYALKLF